MQTGYPVAAYKSSCREFRRKFSYITSHLVKISAMLKVVTTNISFSREGNTNLSELSLLKYLPLTRAAHRGATGAFCPGPQPERGPRRPHEGPPGGPMKGPLNTCLKDRYTLIEQSDLNTLIEQSDLNTLIEQSQYSSEEQCSKLIDKEIWLVMGSYCHCQQVVTFFFFFFFFFFGLHLTTWVKSPTLTLCPGPLNFSGRPCH